jgi:hypothetical protein
MLLRMIERNVNAPIEEETLVVVSLGANLEAWRRSQMLSEHVDEIACDVALHLPVVSLHASDQFISQSDCLLILVKLYYTTTVLFCR